MSIPSTQKLLEDKMNKYDMFYYLWFNGWKFEYLKKL